MAKKYKLGLVLSGGGVKGIAHAGAILALEEFGLKPDIIAGTSAGAIAAVMYASGITPSSMARLFKTKKSNQLVTVKIPGTGFLSLERFQEFLEECVGVEMLEDLPIPVRVVASDLDHGHSVVFKSGKLSDRVMASASVPIVFSPKEIDGVHYVDGGVFKNFPVGVIREECEKVIGINVSPLVSSEYKMNLTGIADRVYNFMFRANTIDEREKCDVLVETKDALHYGTFNLSKSHDIFRLGYKVTKAELKKNGHLLLQED